MIREPAVIAKPVVQAAQVVLAQRQHQPELANGQMDHPVHRRDERPELARGAARVQELLELVQIHHDEPLRATRRPHDGQDHGLGRIRPISRLGFGLAQAELLVHRLGQPDHGRLAVGPAVDAHRADLVRVLEFRDDRRAHYRRLARARRAVHGEAALGQDAGRELTHHALASEEELALIGLIGPRSGKGIARFRAHGGAVRAKAPSVPASASASWHSAAIRL
jgi:hypothetical protein